MNRATAWLRRVDLRRFEPVEHAGFELLCMRVFFAAVAAFAIPGELPYADQPEPVGLAHFFDFTFLSHPATLETVRYLYWTALALFAAGIVPGIAIAVSGFLFIAAGTLIGSQGADKHHLQVLGIVFLVLAIHYLWQAIRNWKVAGVRPPRETHSLGAHFAKQAIVATYLVTGIYKVARSGTEWITESRFYPLQLAKTRWQKYYNRLEEPEHDGFWAQLPAVIEEFLYNHPVWCSIFLTMGLLLEIGAFMMMAGRWWGFWYGLAVIGFHLTISRVMSLTFEYNMLLIAVFFVNLPWLATRLPRPPHPS